jgi:hypothetical protein
MSVIKERAGGHLMKLHEVLNYWFFTAAVLMLPTLPSKGEGNLVYNGDFEIHSNAVSLGWTYSQYVGFSLGGNPGRFALLYNSNPSDPTVPTVSQTISGLSSGQIYKVSGDYRLWKRPGGSLPSDPSFGVAIDGTFLFETLEPANTDWLNFSFDYTATSPSVVLSLSSQINGTDVPYAIDNIAMYATPEPSTISLIFLGSGVLITIRRIKKPSRL